MYSRILSRQLRLLRQREREKQIDKNSVKVRTCKSPDGKNKTKHRGPKPAWLSG